MTEVGEGNEGEEVEGTASMGRMCTVLTWNGIAWHNTSRQRFTGEAAAR